jgi:hypothetical protein
LSAQLLLVSIRRSDEIGREQDNIGMTEKSSNNLIINADRQQNPSWVTPTLLGTIASAAILRLWGIDYGLPYEGITYNQITWEEIQEVHRALKLGAGEYAWVFGKGGLYYLLFLEYGAYFVVSWLLGWVSNPQEFAVQFIQDRTPFYLMGRLTNLGLGLLTYVVTYAIGSRLYGWRVGLLAAAIGGCAFFHGIFSTVINVDVGMTLALWASFLAYIEYEQSKKVRFLIATGVLAAISIAFKLPGAAGLLFLAMAYLSAPGKFSQPTQVIREGLLISTSLLVALTLIAPEWLLSISRFVSYSPFGAQELSPNNLTEDVEIGKSILAATVVRHGHWTGYIQQLLGEYNLVLTIGALAGLVIGVLNRHKWDIILGAFIIIFVGTMSLSWRTQSEHYLLPIMPAMWLLGSRTIAKIADKSRISGLICFLLVVALPITAYVRYSFETRQPDTRIQAKLWIETNIPAGAKILIDGMQYRYIPSPPLNPDNDTLNRQISKAIETGGKIGRGVSDLALSIYKEAQEQIQGPKYDLYSTIYGVGLKEPSYYVRNCFDYVITSSYITRRFAPEKPRRELFPNAAYFYDTLLTNPSFELAYQIKPQPWKTSGPSIDVYRVATDCSALRTG